MARGNPDENELLGRIAKAFAKGQSDGKLGLRLGIGDDAALFVPKPGCETILTCDWFLEGTHFLREKHPADSIGWKCLARAVSDVAAMGGTPRCFLLSLALPASHTGKWLDEFLGGLRRAARRFGCALAGGDTTRHEKILINVSVAGEVRTGRAVLRSGARPGDLIYVSGRLGEAELGLRLLLADKGLANKGTTGMMGIADKNNPLLTKHLYPEPRLRLGRWLAEKRIATAMMDLSDGLSSDLARLCAASGVGARIDEAKLPVVKLPARSLYSVKRVDPVKLALDGGDDYELLFTVPKVKARLVPHSFESVGLTQIGEVTFKRKVTLLKINGELKPVIPNGWNPFRV